MHFERNSVLWQRLLFGRERHLRHLDEHNASDLLDRVAASGEYHFGTIWVRNHERGLRSAASDPFEHGRNIAQTHRYFNSTLLTASAGNLSSILADANNGSPASAVATAVTDFLLARIEPTYDPSDSNNGIVATIGRAPPTASATSSGRPAATGDASQNNGQGGSTTSGAVARGQRRTSKVTLAAVGFTAGAFLAGVGLLL